MTRIWAEENWDKVGLKDSIWTIMHFTAGILPLTVGTRGLFLVTLLTLLWGCWFCRREFAVRVLSSFNMDREEGTHWQFTFWEIPKGICLYLEGNPNFSVKVVWVILKISSFCGNKSVGGRNVLLLSRIHQLPCSLHPSLTIYARKSRKKERENPICENFFTSTF